MEDRELVYQRLILRQRLRYRNEGRPWPGSLDTARAASLYPNLLAELDASGESLENLAEYARVSLEVMAAVLEDGEELSPRELRRLAYHLKAGSTEYLSAPVLQMVKPDTRRGKALWRQMCELLERAEGLPVVSLQWVMRTRETLAHGRPVTYAEYRWACRWLLEALEKKTARGHRVRAARMKSG